MTAKFTLMSNNDRDHTQNLAIDGTLLATVDRHDVIKYYASEDATFRKDVDGILAQIVAKQAIAREENHRRFNAESKAREDQRAIAAERALAKGLGR